MRGKDFHTYVLLGNGECDEGAVWEAAMSASQFNLGNLTAIADDNAMQSDGESAGILSLAPLEDKFRAFGWDAVSVDGHDADALYSALSARDAPGPQAVIARTIKGKGVSFMENNKDWHHNRLTKNLYEQAIAELEAVPDV
jgi:transketolase